jgi:SAM domain (Sterile alpha motif)
MSPTLRGAAAMQQVSDWLERLDLGQYAQRFAENDISFSVLPDLTDQDLKGHRRQSLREISNLGKMAAPRSRRRSHRTRATAERRQVTVMFSDLVGSTALP